MINPQTYQAMQTITTMAFTVMALQSMYQLALLGVPLALPYAKPTLDEVMKEFQSAGKKYSAGKITRNDTLELVAVIVGRDVEVNPGKFLGNYMTMYMGEDWQYWKRYVHRVMLHEVKHPKIDEQLRELECWGYPQDKAEYRTQWLLEDWYIERILLKDYPLPPLGTIKRDDWDVFGVMGQEEIVLILMALVVDIDREFGDTPLPEMKRICMEVRELDDMCRVYMKLVGLYDRGLRLSRESK